MRLPLFIDNLADLYIDNYIAKYYDESGGEYMSMIRGAIERTVSISHFNRGLAGKIFREVKKTGAKVVMKNNVAECVLLSPEEYIQLMDEVNDARLHALAIERLAHYDPEKVITQEEVDRRFGFDLAEIEAMDEVEFE